MTRSRLNAGVLEAEQRAGAAKARLDLVRDQDDTVARGNLAQGPHEVCRSREEAAVALDRLDQDRSDAIGRDLGREHLVQGAQRNLRSDAAVGIRIGGVVDFPGKRPEVLLVGLSEPRQRRPEQRAAIESRHEKPRYRGGSYAHERSCTAFSTASAPDVKNAVL